MRTIIRALFTAAMSTISLLALAGPNDMDPHRGSASDLGGPLSIGGAIGLQGFFKDVVNGTDKETPYGVTSITLDAQISEQVRAHVMVLAYQNLLTMGVDKQNIEKLLYEAYIKISNVGGKPVAFVIGKQSVAFGQTLMKLPNAGSDPSLGVTLFSEVIGVTVSLENVGFFDLVEASAFETERGDLKVGDFDGGSIRLTKKLSDKLKLQVSAMHAGKGERADENRGSVGLLFKDGNWSFWAQGVCLDGNNYYPNTHWSAIVGGEYKWGGNQRIVVQALYLNEAFASLSIGYSIEVLKDVYLSPEIRYVDRENGTSEFQYIVTSEYRFHVK
jgi:hypothetical protein